MSMCGNAGFSSDTGECAVEQKTGKEQFFERVITLHQKKQDALTQVDKTREQKLSTALEEEHPQVAQAFYDIAKECPHFAMHVQPFMYGATYIISPDKFKEDALRSVWVSVGRNDVGKLSFIDSCGNNRYTRHATQEVVACDLYTHAANMGYIRTKRAVLPSGKAQYSIEAGPAFRL